MTDANPASRIAVSNGRAKTSYNSRGNKKPNGHVLSGNFAGIGFVYDAINDVFYEPQPYPSWSLDENWIWQPPIKFPADGKSYYWDEKITTWVEQNV